MKPGKKNYYVKAGDCLPLNVVLKDEDSVAINLTGYGSDFVLSYGILTLTLDETSRLTVTAGTGSITGQLTAAETAVLTDSDRASYAWSVTEPGGCKKTFMTGRVFLAGN